MTAPNAPKTTVGISGMTTAQYQNAVWAIE